MSLKRYAILAAVSQLHSSHNGTVLTTTTTTTTSSTTAASAVDSEELTHSQEQDTSSSFTTYYSSGLGLYHQQRGIASGGGISLLNGASGSMGNGGGIGGASGPQTYANVVNGNVNLLLGGAMLSLVTTILCVVCYCCHRNIKKRTEAAYRQQQHQWLENDPNMEIYSVEQCYETSGLFLGDSTDGLSALPTLHHEPPPSYDAVVLHEQQLLQQQQQLEQQQLQLQQQQLLLQRVSPPPGYRSSLDISSLQQAAVSGANRGTPDGSVDAVVASGSGGVNKQLERVLNAQSCCSLQRAEVENMWNAAAAAVAARSGNCLELDTYCSPQPPPSAPLALQARKHGQTTMRLNSFGRRYLQQSHQHSHYRRGCPLCGKFRYEMEADEEAVTALSVESGLNLCSRTSQEEEQSDMNDNMNANAESALVLEDEADADADAANGNVEAFVETANNLVTDENDNNAVASTTSSSNEEATVSPDLSNINENGIISLDMSKIIDRSGLPTYEGALKLESSGYV